VIAPDARLLSGGAQQPVDHGVSDASTARGYRSDELEAFVIGCT
jgi:hypothetical protein